MKRGRWTTWAASMAAVVAVLAAILTTRAADEKPSGQIDWNRAQQIYQRSRNGETLTDEDRAQQIYERFRRGENLRDEDRAYLERAKQSRGQGGPGKPQGGPAAPPPKPTEHTGLVPLDEMSASDRYKGEDGGLYGGGKNVPPPEHQNC